MPDRRFWEVWGKTLEMAETLVEKLRHTTGFETDRNEQAFAQRRHGSGLIFDTLPLDQAEFDCAPIQAMLTYWRSKCDGDDIPHRDAIEPHEIPAVLPDLYLMNVGDGGLRFQYRLVGTRIEEFLGMNFTGLWIDEVRPATILDRVLPLYRKTVCERRPVFSEGTFHKDGEVHLHACRLYAPLRTANDEIGQLICVQTLEYSGDLDNGSYREVLTRIRDGLLAYEQDQYLLL